MIHGFVFEKEAEIYHCVICRKFYQSDRCDCVQISLKFRDLPLTNALLYVTVVICNRVRRLLAPKKLVVPRKIHLKGFRDIRSRQEIFAKYVYLNEHTGREFFANCSFYVYMMATTNSIGEEAEQAQAELPRSYSGTSNVLTRISNSLKRKKRPEESSPPGSSEICSEGDTKLSCRSKIPVANARSSDGKKSFFRKLLSKEASPEEYASAEESLTDEDFVRCCSSHVLPQIRPAALQAYYESDQHNLAEVIEFAQQLQESESHLSHVISKYIRDRSLEKEMLSVLSNHAKVRLDTERRAQRLAQELWLQQSEALKAQEANLRENLNSVVRQNRRLQVELNETIKKNEKLNVTNARKIPEYMRHPLDSSNQVMEGLSRNNDQLRYKTGVLTAQVEEHEREYALVQRKNQQLEQQVGSYHTQMNNYKAMLQRMQTENELERANLSHQFHVSQETIKECAEAGDVLLEDMDSLKRQLKTMPCNFNWTKFKNRGNNLPDLIYMCRSCLNELAKELLARQTDLALKEKDRSGLQDEIERLRLNLDDCKGEKVALVERVKGYDAGVGELKRCTEECGRLQRELGEFKLQLGKASDEREKDQNSLRASAENVDQLNQTIIEKEEESILNKEKMCEYKLENDGLRMQIHGLKQILTASGSGDVVRELADVHEKMTFFQSQYYQLLSERNYLIEQLQTANVERGALDDFQTSYYEFIQSQRQDLEILNRDNSLLREKLEREHGQITALSSENGKLQEEKTVMREIYHQLKNEIAKVQQLQGEVSGMNIEASRLTIIAEYNQQLGEKLQCEMAERDAKIVELQTDVEKLNSAQLENSKDKVALCVELTEVCSLNDRLNSSLALEHNKCADLDQSKRMVETCAERQLRAAEEMQKSERAALRELLDDFKNVVAERDNLVVSQNEYVEQISDLRANSVVQARNLQVLNEKYFLALRNIEDLENLHKDADKNLTQLRTVAEEKERRAKILEDDGQKLKVEKESLEMTKGYLQNTVHKLHGDLNEARKSELEIKQVLSGELEKIKALQLELDRDRTSQEKSAQNYLDLAKDAANAHAAYEKLLSDYNEHVENAAKTEEGLKNSFERIKTTARKTQEEVERLEEIVMERDVEYLELQEHSRSLMEQLQQLETSTDDIDVQSKLLSESNEALVRLKAEHANCTSTIANLNDEKLKLQKELRELMDEMNTHYACYKACMDDLTREHKNQKKTMLADLMRLSRKLEEIACNWENEKIAHGQLLIAYRELVEKLLGSVRIIIDEKLNRQNADISSLSQHINHLTSEKLANDHQSHSLLNQLDTLKCYVDDLTRDKRNLQGDLENLQELYQTKIKESRRKRSASPPNNTELLVNELQNKLETTEERRKQLKIELENGHNTIMQLRDDIADLEQKLTVVEFQKCEMALRLHEIEAAHKMTENINLELSATNHNIVVEILKMTGDGKIPRVVSETLLQLLHTNPNHSIILYPNQP